MPKMDAADALLAALLPEAEPGFPHYIFRTDEETREFSCRATADVLDFYAELINAHGTRGAPFYLAQLVEKHGGNVADVAAGGIFFERLCYREDTAPYFEKCVMSLAMGMCEQGNRVIKMPPNDFGFPSTRLPTLFVPRQLTVYKFGDREKLGQTILARPHMRTPRDMIVLHVFCANVKDSLTVCFHEEGAAANATQRIQLAHMETVVLAGRAIREFRISVRACKRASPVYLFKLVPNLMADGKRKRDERGNDE